MGQEILRTDRALIDGLIQKVDTLPPSRQWVYNQALDAYVPTNYSTAIAGEPNGFCNQDDVALSWDDATRTLTITPVGASYEVFSAGVRGVKTSAESIAIDDVEGGYFIYFDGSLILRASDTFDSDLIGKYALVAYVYWDATNKEAVPDCFSELHGDSMAPATHRYLHLFEGTRYEEGLGAAMDSDGDGSSASDAQFSAGSGVIWDEDVKHVVPAKDLTDTFKVVYRDGPAGNWRAGTASSYLALATGSGRAAWNEWTGATWQLTEVNNNDFVLAHVFAIPGINDKWCVIMGQGEYNTTGAARDAAKAEINSLNLSGLPWVEGILVASVILQTSNGYANAVKSRIRPTDDGDDYVSWLTSPAVAGASPGSHNNLPNIQGGAVGEYYHLTAAVAAALEAVPTADPLVAGVIWNDAGTLKASAG